MMMMRSRAKTAAAAAAFSTPKTKATPAAAELEDKWEVRPSGMLVQKRDSISEGDSAPVPTIRVKVKHGGVHHEIYISSQDTFGELKKMLSARTGLHPEDQKLVFKHKERDSKSFLDTSGVRDRSKIVLLEDPSAQARRLLDLRRADKLEKAAKSISQISIDVDKLVSEVSALEAVARKGGRVAEDDVIRLTEMLMNELIKLDAVVADGDAKVQRRMQVKRVQKYVETLDAIKTKNAAPRKNKQINEAPPATTTTMAMAMAMTTTTATATATATNWEQFDLLSSIPSASSAASTATATSADAPFPRFDWELF